MKYSLNRTIFVLLALLVLAALACTVSPISSEPTTTTDITRVPTAAVPTPIAGQADNIAVVESGRVSTSLDLEQALIDLYQRVNPSVVHILVYQNRGDTFPLGSGSGFVYDSAGRIVTNNHVVADGAVFEVIFASGERRRAEVIGSDVDSDLAVVEVESLPAGAQPIELGDSGTLRVGQLVIAIGNPFGEQGSMSLGIVSGLGRSLESQRSLDEAGGRYSLPEVIQTDAPINPGNSGGPLLNLQGQVVGVNSAIRSTTGVNSGVGFSIPVNAIRRIIPRLIEVGSYEYAFIGVQIQSLNLNLQERYALPRVSGAYVTGVTAGGPAEEAGLVPGNTRDGTGGDLIVAIDGRSVRDTEELIAYLVFNTEVGQTVDLTVIRDKEEIIVPLTLGARP